MDPRERNFIYSALGEDPELNKSYAIYPYEMARYADSVEKLSQVQSFVDSANDAGRKAVLFLAHDTDFPMTKFITGETISFRYSMSKSHTYTNEFMIPPKIDGYVAQVGSYPNLPWSATPKVSFMGFSMVVKPQVEDIKNGATAPKDDKGNVRGLISPQVFQTPALIGAVLRKRAVEIIEKDERIESNFLMRQQYYFHFSEEFQNATRGEYIKSMRDTHYVLAFRGCGNYSIRLFETLASARLPIQLDTNQHLPFEDLINWQEVGIWVPLPKLSTINDEVLNFHAGMSESEYQAKCDHAEEIFNDYLSRSAVVGQVRRILECQTS